MYNETPRKIGLIMVTYNHCPNYVDLELSERYVKYLIIIDNNSNNEVTESLTSFYEANVEKRILIKNSNNLGTAKAYNIGIRKAIELGLNSVYLFDHDAHFDRIIFIEFDSMLKKFDKEEVNFGALVPIISDSVEDLNKEFSKLGQCSFVKKAIISGMILNIDAWKRLGGFDESFFVEGVDFELSERLYKLELPIIRRNKCMVTQKFGQSSTSIGNALNLRKFINSSFSLLTLVFCRSNVVRKHLSNYSAKRRKEYYNSIRMISKRNEKFILITEFHVMIAKLLDLVIG